MSDWPLAFVVAVGVAGLVALVWVVLPFVRSRSDEAARAAALADVNKRLTALEATLMQPRFPAGLPRRVGG